MKLKHIAISNFKGIQADNLSPESFTCLVGENNAGKSSVMQAIVFALNRPKNIPSAHFYDSSQPVSFDFVLSGVNEAHLARLSDEAKGKIAGLIVDEELALRVAYAPGESVSIQVKAQQPKEERYRPDAIDAVLSGKKGQAAIEEALWTTYPEFKAAYSEPLKLLGTAKAFVKEQVAKLPPEQFISGYSALPSGISASISPLLPEPIYIPAVKNLNDDLKTSQSTSFGRLLGLLLEDMAEDLAHVNTALEKVNSLFNRVTIEGKVVDGRHAKVRGLESEVEGLLSANFPNVRVQLEIPPPELKTILNAAQIFIDDGSHDLIDNKGDGIKRSLTFALLQAYVNRQDKQKVLVGADGKAPRPLIFLFEEPELYLHPRSQRVLFNTLARISENHQVLVTTHSPLFFAPGVTASFVRVAKQAAAPKPIAKLFPVNFALNKADAETFRLARFEHADAAFFSQSVVLFEGESDDAYCKHVAQLFKDEWDFERRNVALVRVSGKGNFLKFRNFFESFGISVRLVADLDAIFDGFKHLGTDKESSDLRDKLLQTLDGRIAALGTRAEPKPRQIQRRANQDSWKDRYEAAKAALQAVQAGAPVDAKTYEALEGLFVWEKEIARMRVCTEDAEAAAALVPLLDCLRGQGVCVLSRGAIEDYYPAVAPGSGPKPDRALAACAAVLTREEATALSKPLAAGRPTELEEVFEALFKH